LNDRLNQEDAGMRGAPEARVQQKTGVKQQGTPNSRHSCTMFNGVFVLSRAMLGCQVARRRGRLRLAASERQDHTTRRPHNTSARK